MKAIWNDQVIAESNETKVLEGNHYFPAESIKKEFFVSSDMSSVCAWKGTASYYDVTVNGKTNQSAAWYYPEISEMAKAVEGYVAFWRGVEITE